MESDDEQEGEEQADDEGMIEDRLPWSARMCGGWRTSYRQQTPEKWTTADSLPNLRSKEAGVAPILHRITPTKRHTTTLETQAKSAAKKQQLAEGRRAALAMMRGVDGQGASAVA